MTDDKHDDDRLPLEEVERRRELRGLAAGLTVTLTDDGRALETLEASRRSFFVRVADPDSFRLGDIVDARIGDGQQSAACRLEVIRKEIDPRRGVALRLVQVDPTNEAALQRLLGPLAE